jgi:serine O-acetyltransferase
MVGIKARSTLVPAEAWMRDFVPYGTPCDDPPCDDQGRPRRDCIEKLEGEVAVMREEMAAMKALLAERALPAPETAREPADAPVRLRKRAAKD